MRRNIDEGTVNLLMLMIGRLVSFKFGNVSQLDPNLNPIYWPLFKDIDPNLHRDLELSFNYHQSVPSTIPVTTVHIIRKD